MGQHTGLVYNALQGIIFAVASNNSLPSHQKVFNAF